MTKKQQKPPKQNNALHVARKKIIIQAAIAIQTIVITAALIFGMSAAWYTNVLQTSGLQFEAAAWGFTGTVAISDDPVQASPGETGVVGVHVTNTGDEIVDVAVRVSKDQMELPMRQRFFFYVDTGYVRNGETMDRVYINTRDSYTYSILSHNELVLTHERANDVQLKWQWVYDMLGYYFVGSVTQTTDAESNLVVVTDVEDYLRPVEYDLDKATFQDGFLSTVDGVDKDEFLTQLSQKDGYANGIVASNIPGYYKVDVDENGHGIWVYLCNWAEIQQATTYDSQLGKEAADAQLSQTSTRQFTARLTVVGQETRTDYVDISTADQLVEELQKGALVRLQQDVVLTEALALDSGVKTVLDLNGHTVTGPADTSMIQIQNSSHLTVMNGELIAQDPARDVIAVRNSSLTFSGVKIHGSGDDGIDIDDQSGSVDSCIRIFDSEIDIAGCPVFVRGNGTLSDAKTQVIVENATLNSSGYIAIMGNGTNTFWGTDVHVYKSRLTGYYAAVYQPQDDSIVRVTESRLTGMNGVVLKAGDLVVTDSTITATGEAAEPKYALSGYTDTGDAIYADGSYNCRMNIRVTGESVIESAHNLAVRVFIPDGFQNLTTVELTGGTYSSDVSMFVPDGYVFDPVLMKITEAQGNADPEDATEAVAEEGAGDEE